MRFARRISFVFPLYFEWQYTPNFAGALRAPAGAYKTQRARYKEFVACQVKTLLD